DEVRGDRDGRGDATQDLFLREETVQQGVRGEPVEVELLRGVGEGRRHPGWVDLRPVAVALRPERGAPRGVEGVEVGVALTQPAAEVLGGDIAVAGPDVAAEFVA